MPRYTKPINLYNLFKVRGNPKSLLEAMSCGYAVIGTNTWYRGIEHEINGLLVKMMLNLREAVLDLIKDKKREKIGRKRMLICAKPHSIKIVLPNEISMFEEFKEKEPYCKVKAH